MAKNPEQLNRKQHDVLEWVRDGSPDGVYTEGWEHRITARALERRGLVKISGRGPSWVAEITRAGQARLSIPKTVVAEPDESEATLLVRQVVEAGGTIRIAATGDELQRWQRLVRASLHSPNRPHGQKLSIAPAGHWGSGEYTIALANHFEDLVSVRPVEVPQRVTRYHPLIQRYLADKDWQYVSKEHLRRAAMILQAVVTEAERRCVEVRAPGQLEKSTGQPIYKPIEGHVWLITDRGDYSVEVRELAGKGGAKLTFAAQSSAHRPRWVGRRQTEFISTGRLELILNGRLTAYRGQRFRDTRTQTVEDLLPAMFAALDKYMLEAEWLEKDAARKEEDEARQHEVALENAHGEYVRKKRWEHFLTLVEQHEEAGQLRSFLDQADTAATVLSGDRRLATQAYLAEIRASIDTRDAITSPELLLPVVPMPTEQDLQALIPKRSLFGRL